MFLCFDFKMPVSYIWCLSLSAGNDERTGDLLRGLGHHYVEVTLGLDQETEVLERGHMEVEALKALVDHHCWLN